METGPSGQTRVRRMNGTRYDEENILQIKNSGWKSLMCVASFSYAGIGPIVRSIGNFNSEQYVAFLENNIIPYAVEHFPNNDYYILHDNSRIHTSNHTMAYLILRFGPKRIIPHPPNSPDCNPIENLFGLLTKNVRKNREIFGNEELLFNKINLEWNRLGNNINTLQDLALSMPKRYRKVIKNNGCQTRY